MFKQKLALETLEDRCRALEHRCEDLERSHKGLALEWEELYDKVRHQMSRMSRRTKADAKLAPEIEDEGPSDSTGNRLDTISEGILRRRAGYGAKP